ASSLGQHHWFCTNRFVMDYSLYNGSKAAKGCYSSNRWDQAEWESNLENCRRDLDLLDRPQQSIRPGKYRVYLAPAAVGELLGTMSWSAFSQSAFKTGFPVMKKLFDRSASWSPKISIRENFSLGLAPAFNSFGEVAPNEIDLIRQGQLINLLTNSRTGKEYAIPSNQANVSESPRSLEMDPGGLEENDILSELGTGLYLSNLHYCNWSDPASARITGMTRYACFFVEGRQIAGPISDMRFDVSLYDIWGTGLIALTKFRQILPETGTYSSRSFGGMHLPGMLIEGFTFTL
ncbi:MAG: metallopeptidase TldD-related protein, partial [Bdellovibrionaceae bacterium]|nr:metallopeptidase TldD-related protein [Pseudobdellovibrionaceae bacterium]